MPSPAAQPTSTTSDRERIVTHSLSVVIPVYNEPHWLPVAVESARAAIARSSFTPAEIVLVDDGSNEETRRVIDELALADDIVVARHDENRGRLAARTSGVGAARHDYILFLDSRVTIHEGSLAFVAGQITDPDHQVWNATVEIDDAKNPYARFWQITAELAWPDYFSEDKQVRYGPEEYERYPKGTGCFLAPRADIIAAMQKTTSHYADTRRGSDELFLRRLVERHMFNIAPGFDCTYRARPSFKGFVRHAHHRGVFFVDGFLRPGTRFFRLLLIFFPASLIFLAAGLRHPRKAAGALLGTPLLGLVGGVATRRSRRDIGVLSALGGPFLVAFSAGIWRGLVVLVRDRARR
jgi:glycosyltransferase involved in cell wall biosynthesis